MIKGITQGLRIEGIGTVQWSLMDVHGNLRHLLLPAYYIPSLTQHLLSTTAFNKAYPGNSIAVGSPCWRIAENPNDPLETAIDVYINRCNNLPTSTG